ncbi:uncharacterized protein T551_02523 [Pneumocystis jirovecii RU7]|uniref:ICE2-domain-containing protein n=1 Tax=Pneumocystis jirovecii (strain RU7) TaxID=1408657 RepID=A0A0W4ZJW0_PNEJ7|nr:uncharacterized protein T551_02523 [Pneumocystis jirovecii RU7]KTW28673.1 hypothetical protein T551_02523 [Pneumocystis jirovecii RU7]
MGFIYIYLKTLLSTISFGQLILTIALAFDLGGRTSGLAYTLSLEFLYFFICLLSIITKRSKMRILVQIIMLSQFLVVPSLMIYFLDTISEKSPHSWFIRFITNTWLAFLTRSTPIFTLLEGFTSLLVIQALGQCIKWLVNNSSDSWMIILLSASGGILSASFYFLYQIYTTLVVSIQNATLIGILLTCAVFISTYGIHTGRGNVAEGSLLFAYLVYSIYMICSNLQSTGDILRERNMTKEGFILPFPPIIMESYTTIVSSIAFKIPKTLWRMLFFLRAIASTITPSIVTSLVYRLSVLYAATRIVPAIRCVSQGVKHVPSLDDEEPTSRIMGLLISFSPCILIAVYTHLLLQHFSLHGHDAQIFGIQMGSVLLWRWLTAFMVVGLYAIEISLGDETAGDILISNWKTE